MPVDFTKQMKKEYTILSPDIFSMHMELIAAVFRMYGYHMVVAKYEGREVIDTGLKYLHNDMCYPAICSLGQQLYGLTCGDFDPHKTALIQFQTGGGCRASNYIFLLRRALKNMGLGDVPVISLSFSGLEKYSGFKLTPGMIAIGLRSVIYGDMLMLLKNQCRPYEAHPGDTQRVVDRWLAELVGQFRRKRGLTAGAIRRNLAAMARDFHNIPRIPRTCTKVGIVGEIYVKYSSFGNNGLEEFLLSQGCEFMVPGVLGFFQYCFSDAETDAVYYGNSAMTRLIGRQAERLCSGWEHWLEEALEPYPEFVSPISFTRTKALADRVIDRGVKMGEGWLLPGEAAALIEMGYPNIICAQPFGCLPNHIVGKGTIRRLRELYPDANIFPVDYDAGASKVNQENRIKLMLAIAREQAGRSGKTDVNQEAATRPADSGTYGTGDGPAPAEGTERAEERKKEVRV